MADEVSLWQVEDDNLKEISRTKLNREERIEKWIRHFVCANGVQRGATVLYLQKRSRSASLASFISASPLSLDAPMQEFRTGTFLPLRVARSRAVPFVAHKDVNDSHVPTLAHPPFSQGFPISSRGYVSTCTFSNLDWWRRRESNPRPKMLLVKRLHAYSRSCPRPSAFPPSPRRSRPPLRTDKKRLPLA